MKKHAVFIIFFGLTLIVSLWELIILRGGFVSGDYSVQFYPWSMLYSESIKNLSFPYWIRYVQCGFPLMAEGQIGGFYPFHIIFYFLLPFRAAYNYLVLAHFIMAGLFTYIYTCKIGACRWGGTLSAIVFCFGSAYAGCMINTATLKTVAWFPLILLLVEYYFDNGKPRFLAFAGIILGVQLLSGAPQIGFYGLVMTGVYYAICLIAKKHLNVKSFLWGMLMPAIALLIFLPQLLLSRPMSALSWRADAGLDFALTLSLSPLNFISAVFPRPIFHGPGTYIGLLTLLFLISGFLAIRKSPNLYPLIAVFLAGIFIALGGYNPLFVAIIRALEFYDLRGPSKAIVFSIFSASVLAGVGGTLFLRDENIRKRSLKFFSGLLIFCLAGFFTARVVLIIFKDNVIAFGDEMVKRYVYGKPFHRYDLGMYFDKVRSFYGELVKSSSLVDIFMLFSIVLSVVLLIFALYLYRRERKPGYMLRSLFLLIIIADLFFLSGHRGKIKDFETLEPGHIGILELLTEDQELFRVLPYDIVSRKLPAWLDPSLNAIHSIDSVAIYTPLASEYYREGTDALEVVDNALGYKSPNDGVLSSEIELIRALNVKYVITPREQKEPFLKYVMSEEGVFVYELEGYLPRAFISKDLTFQGLDTEVEVDIREYSAGRAVLKVDMPYEGFLIFSENRYPGWRSKVNNRPAEIHPFSVIQAVSLEKGLNKVEFKYHPFASLRTGEEG
jgi:hypothetical protein